MSNYNQIVRELTACFAARTPLVVLDTDERDRAQSALKQAAQAQNVEVDFYTSTDGFQELRRGNRNMPSSDPLAFIEQALKGKGGGIYALGDVRFLDGDNSFSRKTAGIVRLAAQKKSTLVIVTADPVWQGLGKLGMYLKLDLPSGKEREEIVRDFVALHKIKKFTEEDISQSATIMSGYTAMQLGVVMNYVYHLESGFTYSNLYDVAARKDKLFGKISSVSRVELGNVHVAGLSGVKNWLARKQRIFFAPKEELDYKYIRPPKGVLLVGVPGCGKSLSARLIAKEWKLPLYRFDIGALFDKYVGESEKNLRIALDYINSVSPCVVWIDEIEKELYSGGDSDTSKRVLGEFLYWIQENNSRVFFIATANDISKIPPELFRKGRFDEIFFVDLPDCNERRSAIVLYSELCLSFKLNKKELDVLSELSEGFSYADIECAIKSVAEEEYVSGETRSFNDLKTVFEKTVSINTSNNDLISSLRQWGSECAVSASDEGRKRW